MSRLTAMLDLPPRGDPRWSAARGVVPLALVVVVTLAAVVALVWNLLGRVEAGGAALGLLLGLLVALAPRGARPGLLARGGILAVAALAGAVSARLDTLVEGVALGALVAAALTLRLQLSARGVGATPGTAVALAVVLAPALAPTDPGVSPLATWWTGVIVGIGVAGVVVILLSRRRAAAPDDGSAAPPSLDPQRRKVDALLIALTVGVVLVLTLVDVPRGYWLSATMIALTAPMAAVGDEIDSRFWGTVAGSAIALVLGALLPAPVVLAVCVGCVVLALPAMALSRRAFVAATTVPTLVLAGGASPETTLLRVELIVIGCLLVGLTVALVRRFGPSG